jgi:hypothetical protein
MFDLEKEPVFAFYLSKISAFYTNFAIDGIHFTNVQNVAKEKNGIVLLKCINILSQRMCC